MHDIFNIVLLIILLFSEHKKLVVALLCNSNYLRGLVDNNFSKQMYRLRDKENICATKLLHC